MFAVELEPGGICSWLFVGLIAGWLTGLLMRGTGYGILRDIILGLVGAFVGGVVVSLFPKKSWVSGAVSASPSSAAACWSLSCVCSALEARCDAGKGYYLVARSASVAHAVVDSRCA
jgi:uncharacterized membrane protein YeaQ/YmgE (transglycosylase-associated protein family)